MSGLRIVSIAFSALAIAGAGMYGIFKYEFIGPSIRNGAETQSLSRIGGKFRLTSHHGLIVTEQDLKGRPTAVLFGFTHCPDVCPTALFALSNVLKELGEDGDKINPIFITVDPERDTKEVLSDYMQFFDPRILALTGTQAEAATPARAYKAHFRKVHTENGMYTMDHTAIVYLMDSNGRMVSSLDPHERHEVWLTKLKQLNAR